MNTLTTNQQLDLIKFVNSNACNISHDLLNESIQTKLSDAVLDKMFELTIGKYSKIDFSEIERSRGDVTRIKFYANLRESIDILMSIQSVTDKIPTVITVSTALSNILSLKSAFEHAFRLKNNIGILIYNTYVYTVMEATSYIISTSIDFIKGEDIDTYSVSVYTESKNNLLIEQLAKLNATVADGTLIKFIDKSYEATEKVKSGQDESINESVILDKFLDSGLKAITGKISSAASKVDMKKVVIGTAAGIALLWVGCNIIPIIRELLYLIYTTRQKLSDAAQVQSDFLKTNIEILKRNNGDEKIIARQEKWVKVFQKIARVFALDTDKADRDAKKEISNDKVDVSAIVI